MAEYFVDPDNGDDVNNGLSVASPWKKIPGQTGANAVVSFRNNAILQTGSRPSIRLPVSGAGDARWQVYNNAVLDTSNAAAIGSTEYATVAAFQSAHATSGGNLQQSDYALGPATYRPLPGSPLIGAGTHMGYVRDMDGKQRPNPPSIGAYDIAKIKNVN